MLQNIRDRFTGTFAIAILALLCVPFVFFGINYDFIGGGYAAKVEGVEISNARFENAYQAELARFAESGNDLQPGLRRLIRQSVLENMIRETLVDVYLAESGFRITDQMITDFIQQVPEFQVDGRFSKDRYYSWLDERALTPAAFEQDQRRALRLAQFQRGLAATAFVTPAEYRRYLNLYAEERRAAIGTFSVDKVAEEVEVSDEEISAYYDNNPAEFQSPESVDLQYLIVDRNALVQAVDISDSELQEYYEQAANRYLQDESRQARHILIPFDDDEATAREQAEEIAARAQAGESFEELARQHSADSGTAGQGGDLGAMTRSQLPDALAGAIFTMDAGDIVGPVRSDFGFHVIRLDNVKEGGPLPLEQVQAEIERELRDIKAEEAFRNLERTLSNALFDARELEDIAKATGLEIQVINGYTRSGSEPFGSNQAVIDAVFASNVLHDDAITNIVEIDADRSAVFQARDYHEAATRPLEEVRPRIVDELRSGKALEIVRTRVREMETALADGTDFATAAREHAAEITPSRLLRRQDDDVDARVLDAIFLAKKPAKDSVTIGNAVTQDGDYAVFSVSSVIPGRPETIPLPERDQGKLQLASEAGAADYTAFILDLERRGDIVRAEDALAEREF